MTWAFQSQLFTGGSRKPHLWLDRMRVKRHAQQKPSIIQSFQWLPGGYCRFDQDPYRRSTTPLEPDMPPGRLAARRIAYEISMRSHRGRHQAQKAAVSSQETSESTWQGDVTRLTENEPATRSIPEIKVLLAVLATYLAMAPSYEGQQELQIYMSELRQQLATETTGPRAVVRPP